MLESLFEKFGLTFDSDQMIFSEYEPGNTCYFLLEGKVKIVKTVGGAQKTLDIIEKGNFFGEMAILETENRSASAIALENVRVLKFTRDNFDTMMNSQPQLALKLLRSFSSRIYDAKRKLQTLLLDDPKLRVIDVFVMLAEKEADYASASRMVFHITVDDVASWCGLPSTDVQKVLEAYAQKRKIEILVDRIVVQNINDFTRLINYHRKNLSH